MNSSKVSLPSSQFTTAYIWFIHLTSFLSWSLVPFLFYIILTQSKGFKSFKWFILNHSFWSLMFETIIGLFSPMLLLPAFAGFPLTIIRENGSIHITSTATFIGILFGLNYIASLFVTIGTRYIATFSTSQQLTQKVLVAAAFLCCAIMYPPIIYGAVRSNGYDTNFIQKNAIAYDAFFQDFNEPSLVFFLVEPMKNILFIGVFILNAFFVIGIVTIIVFIYLVRSNKSVSVTKIQRSLIISSVIQISLSLIFLVLPITIIVVLIIFGASNTSQYGCICLSLVSAHSILEFLATLYFVLPYRRFIEKQIRKFRGVKTIITVVPIHSSLSTSASAFTVLDHINIQAASRD